MSTPLALPTLALHSTQLVLSNCFCQEVDRTGNFDHMISKAHRYLMRVWKSELWSLGAPEATVP